ncbi:hypothetical protein ACFWRV_14925 [Streptomyces sp. NPDC058576]|uniref:hypothetical protein n=1 Tax=Streptomyces sp. NPDC058576 TaxID=3346547 RepID=UPI003668E222
MQTADLDVALVTAARARVVRKIVKLSAVGSGEQLDGATVARRASPRTSCGTGS